MKLRKSAGGMVSVFYDHWARFNIRYALSVLTSRFKNEEDPAFGMWGHTNFGSDFPTVDRQIQQDLCCIAFTDGFRFSCLMVWAFLVCDKTFRSFADYLQAWWESFDHVEYEKQHSLGANTSWSQLQLGNTELQKSHGHIICSHELPSVWILARTP